MASAQPSSTEEAMCCSPESGFGSEIQYSPTNVTENSSSDQSKKLSASRNLQNLFTSNVEEDHEQPLIKIVNVKSLAVDDDDTSCTSNLIVNTDSLGIIEGTKRLYLRKINYKKVLVLDTKLIKNRIETVSCLGNPKSFSHLPLQISFSGLPVISKRVNFELSKSSRDQFVFELFSKEDRKKLSSSIDPFLVPINAEITDVSNHFNTGLLQSTSQTDGPMIEIPRLTVFNLHTQSSVKITSNTLHSNSVPLMHEPTSPPCNSVKSKMVPQPSNSKADRIKRLKEIMAQKEKNLQKVRKTRGFIS